MSTSPTNGNPISMLERMLLIRAYEEKLVDLQQAGQCAGTCTSVGQEAAAVGVVSALSAQDPILTNHRSAGHLLARGADPRRMIAEAMGREAGYCKGKSGSLHMSVKELGVILTSTIVGAELSLVTGVALSNQLLGKPGIATVFFGDGAATEGVFHESLNLAAVWNLPILYVCENNQWQAFVARRDAAASRRVVDHAGAFGIPSQDVDGNDVVAVYEAAREAVSTVRCTGKPFLLEVSTYRLRGHFEPDDQAYVDKAELARWQARDPIRVHEERLLRDGRLTVGDIEFLSRRARQRIDDAAKFAALAPMPDISELTTDVYA